MGLKPKPCTPCKVCGKPVSGFPSKKPKTCGRKCQHKLWTQRCKERKGNLEEYIRKRKEKAEQRAGKILEMADSHTPARKIASDLGITTNTVYLVLKKYRPKQV
jgi:hypothetical protein